jgi:glycosyltransferase involved in cell wall biosynthesis
MAQHYRKPVIASDLPGLAEHIEHGRTGWLFAAGDEVALADLLRDEVSRQRAGSMYAALEQGTEDAGWDNYADTVMRLAEGAKACPRGRE